METNENELKPVIRYEHFINAIINKAAPPEPFFRDEFYYAKIAGADVNVPAPYFRVEFYLAKLAGKDVDIPVPIFRNEFYLAALCGKDVEIPDPISREEHWLYKWLKSTQSV